MRIINLIFSILVEENFKEMYKNNVHLFIIKYLIKSSHSFDENDNNQLEICKKLL